MNTLTVRETRICDIPRILEIYNAAKVYMVRSGNPHQWNTAYPEAVDIENDIKLGHSFVILDGTEVVGTFAFIIGRDPSYGYIEDGQWLDDEQSYGTIHRIASGQTVKGIFDAAIGFASTKINNLRVDTHKDNKTMQHLAESRGFTRCGIVYIDGRKDMPRIAYQRITK